MLVVVNIGLGSKKTSEDFVHPRRFCDSVMDE